MGLFWRRPLCFSYFLFLIISFLSGYIPTALKPWIIVFVSLSLAFALSAFFILKNESSRLKLFIVFMCLLFVALAFVNSYFRIDIPRCRAERFVGENAVEITVVSENYSAEYSSEYAVKINQIGKERVSIKAILACGFDASLSPFDKIYAVSDLSPSNYQDGSLIVAYLESPEGVLCKRAENKGLIANMLSCGADGISIGLGAMREMISEYVKELFGSDAGGLAAGLLMNDKSDISAELIRDFRRSGVSHLLAVSGLHISLLLGIIELLLRRLRIAKNIRCIIVSLLALLLLALAGFSMSACRSVFMLLVLYLNYMLMEGNDSPTSLFFSVFLIVLISPYSIYDLGLFMSFMATLGLVTVYPVFESFLKEQFRKRLPNNVVTRFIRGVINALAITVIANMFLLPVMWLSFGEFSLASFPVNLLVSPIVSVLLPLIALGVCVGEVLFIGDAVVFAVKLFSGLLTGIIGHFSRLPMSTVSLKYDFANVILIFFILSMTVLMLIKLKHRWIFAVPPVASIVAFCISLVIFNSVTAPSLTYYSSQGSDIFFSVDKGSVTVVDPSANGNIRAYREMLDLANEKTAVSVESILITDMSHSHLSTMDYVMRRHIIERIYLPMPQGEVEYYLCKELCELAEEHGVSAELYEHFTSVQIAEGIFAAVLQDSDIVFAYDESVISYTNQRTFRDTDITNASDVIVVGSRNGASGEGALTLNDDTCVIFSSKEAMTESRADFTDGKVYALEYPYYIDLNKLLS